VGTGTPGYAIRSERNSRRMLRGAVVMASAGPDSEGSQFYLLTGTAMHLQGEQVVFGRVVEGQEIVDALTSGDRILKITLRDLDAAARYVPITVAGKEPDGAGEGVK
jgi:peptidylprolyl isomerase